MNSVRTEEWATFGEKGWVVTGREHGGQILAGHDLFLDLVSLSGCIYFVITHQTVHL